MFPNKEGQIKTAYWVDVRKQKYEVTQKVYMAKYRSCPCEERQTWKYSQHQQDGMKLTKWNLQIFFPLNVILNVSNKMGLENDG